MSYLAGAAQIGGVMVGAPLVIGMTRQVRARWEGRAGAGLLQPWRDLLKQLGKQQITPAGTTIVFAAAPVIVAGTTLLIAAIPVRNSPGRPSQTPPTGTARALARLASHAHRRRARARIH